MSEVVIILVDPPRNSKSRYDEYRSLMSMNICDCVNYPHKTAKPIGGDFNAEYVRQHKNHQIGLRTQESYILKC